MPSFADLQPLGWSNHFQSQLSAADMESARPVRIIAVHRNRLEAIGPDGEGDVPPFDDPDEGIAAVGDWLLIDKVTGAPRKILARASLFRRRGAGNPARLQPIAANIDTLFIVSSCNRDFKVARLERYLSLAREAGTMPVILLTKADLADDPGPFVAEAIRLMPGLHAEALDARDPDAVAAALRPWCERGRTAALVGSSGVGKSTLLNTLLGSGRQATAEIRENDSRGRHTTTARSLHRLPWGGWLLDTPGMRELQLADSGDGIAETFAEIAALAAECRFNDCRHDGEPGCAVAAAIADGALDADRLRRYRKLLAEDARNSASVREQRARAKAFGKMARSVMAEKLRRREE